MCCSAVFPWIGPRYVLESNWIITLGLTSVLLDGWFVRADNLEYVVDGLIVCKMDGI